MSIVETKREKEIIASYERVQNICPDIGSALLLQYYFSTEEVSYNGRFGTITKPDDSGNTRVYLVDYNDTGSFEESSEILEIPEGITDIFYNWMGRKYYHAMEVRLPSSVKKIWYRAFSDDSFTNLHKITLNEGLEEIQLEAFADNNCLSELYIPDSVTKISSKAFANCKSLQKIRFPKKLEKIPYMVCTGCISLKKVELPEEFMELEKFAFQGCENLTTISFPSILNDGFVNRLAFQHTAIKNLSHDDLDFFIKDGYCCWKTSPDKAIYYTGKEKDVVIPEWIRIIDYACFQNNQDIQSVTIPNTVTFINEDNQTGAFAGCFNLKTVIFEKGSEITHLPAKCFYQAYQISKIDLPENLVYIGQHAFDANGGESHLKEIEFPSSLRIIGTSAFSHSALEKVTVPENVEYIYLGAFYENKNLKKLEIKAENVFINDGAFRHCDALEEKIIPESTTFGENVFQTTEEEDNIHVREMELREKEYKEMYKKRIDMAKAYLEDMDKEEYELFMKVLKLLSPDLDDTDLGQMRDFNKNIFSRLSHFVTSKEVLALEKADETEIPF